MSIFRFYIFEKMEKNDHCHVKDVITSLPMPLSVLSLSRWSL